MNKPLIFTKMCALGNDFVVIDERDRSHNWQLKEVQKICHRRFGVGADQLLLIRKSAKADASMHIYNQDGSKAKQCGNGLRAVSSLLLAEKQSKCIEIEVGEFVHRCELIATDLILVAFPLPVIKGITAWADYLPKRVGVSNQCHADNSHLVMSGDMVTSNITHDLRFSSAIELDVGNPHLVLWRTLDSELGDFNQLGQSLQYEYQTGINVHAVKRLAHNRIYVDHWERGTGITPSCGSGSIASVFSGIHLGWLSPKVSVENAVSKLTVECTTNEVLLTGAIKVVFSGSISVML